MFQIHVLNVLQGQWWFRGDSIFQIFGSAKSIFTVWSVTPYETWSRDFDPTKQNERVNQFNLTRCLLHLGVAFTESDGSGTQERSDDEDSNPTTLFPNTPYLSRNICRHTLVISSLIVTKRSIV